jgi:hypothetical protein
VHSGESAPAVLSRFFEQTIAARDDLILPLHGGPVGLDKKTVALRTEISDLLQQVLAGGRCDGTIRRDVTAVDIIITGAMLAQPLPHAANSKPALPEPRRRGTHKRDPACLRLAAPTSKRTGEWRFAPRRPLGGSGTRLSGCWR